MYSVDRQWRLELIHTLLLSWSIPLCPIHVVTFNLISNLVTDYIQKRRGEPGLFSLDLSRSITFWVYPHPFEKKGVDRLKTSLTVHTVVLIRYLTKKYITVNLAACTALVWFLQLTYSDAVTASVQVWTSNLNPNTKEVQIVYRLFLVNCYILHVPSLPSQTASNVGGWVIDWTGLNWLDST